MWELIAELGEESGAPAAPPSLHCVIAAAAHREVAGRRGAAGALADVRQVLLHRCGRYMT